MPLKKPHTLPTSMSFTTAVDSVLGMLNPTLLRTRYEEPWRKYHNWNHPTAMKNNLLLAEAQGVKIEDGVAALCFILWHDSVYEPQSPYGLNEQRSAELFEAQVPEMVSFISTVRARTAIIMTGNHLPCALRHCPDIDILLDIDLAILGDTQENFDRYDAGISFEYNHVDKDLYRQKRAEVLEGFLQRDRLYLTDWARIQWEDKARDNLARTIKRLER